MNKRFHFLSKLSILYYLSILLIFTLLFNACNQKNETPNKNDSTFDNIIKNKEIRCGYVIYPPGCIKDPNTGKLTGIFIDALNEAGKNLGIKISWVEEVGWGSMIEGLNTHRYDIIGSPVWANATRAKVADFTIPLFYSGIGVIVRKNDNRFNNLSNINNKNIKIATIDGEMSDIIANSQFPLAQKVSLPQLSDVSQVLLNVAEGKADVAFVEPYFLNEYLKNNSDNLKNIAIQNPIRVFPNTMMIRQGDFKLKAMLNTALRELINNGFIDRLIDKYQSRPNELYKVALPYQAEK